jgi:stage III sporulation protein AE
MKRTFFVFLALLFFAFPITASAYSDEQTEEFAASAGADKLENEYLNEDELSGNKGINVFEKTMMIIQDSLKDNGKSTIRAFGAILSVVLLSCVMGVIKFGESQALDHVCSFISVVAISGVTYSVLYNLFVFITAALETLALSMSALMPVMASLYIYGGNAAQGAASASSLALFLTVLSTICSKVLMPLLQISFAFCIVGATPGSVNLSAVNNLVKNTATTLMAFIFTLLGFTLLIQTTVASASDNFVTKSVRFATGVFVPVIGKMLGDASTTVIASVSVIKGTVGAVGVVMILSAVIPPLLIVVIHKFLLLLCSIAAKTLGCEKESALLYDLGNVMNVLLALVCGAGVVCVIAMAVFIKAGVNL